MLIDYFLFFNEKELLELRINMLKDHVDKFVVCEADKTFSGIPREFQLKKLIKELDLPEDKIQVIELHIPEDDDIIIEDHDRGAMYEHDKDDIASIRAMSRDRIVRNGLMTIIDQFNDDDWFIVSDCDEIINPEHLPFALHVAKSCPDKFVKMPLINLYGEADLRPIFKDGTPFVWRTALYICQKISFNITTPHRIRCEFQLPRECINPTLSGRVFDEFGWHFSWMGGDKVCKIKSMSYAHAPNKAHQDNVKKGFKFKENESIPWDDNSILVKFPHDRLPKEIFKIPRVRKFMLPNYKIKIEDKIKNFPSVNYTSLYESISRREYMDAQFKKYGIRSNAFLTDRYSNIKDNLVVTGSNLEIIEKQLGCLLTHLNNLKNWYITCNEPYAIFCEDDISFESVEYWSFTWDEFMERLPKDWECVQLIRMESPIIEDEESTLKLDTRWGRWWGSHSLIKRSYVKKILDTYCVGYNKYNLDLVNGTFIPIIENVLFVGLGGCINVPLLTEHPEFNSTLHDNVINADVLSSNNQSKSSKIIRDLWVNNGANVAIEELLKI